MLRLIIRLGIGLLFALFGFISYCSNVSEIPVSGEVQRVQLSPRQEVTLGLQARQEMTAQYGGVYPDARLQDYISQVGNRIVQRSLASRPYSFQFYVLRDPQTINAFALPGEQVFITAALLSRLRTEAQLAGVLGHKTGHVIGRHGAEHMAKQQLEAALVNAVGIAASDTPEGGRQAAVIAQVINQLVNLLYF